MSLHDWSEIAKTFSPEENAETKRANELFYAQERFWDKLYPGVEMPDFGDPFYDTVPEARYFRNPSGSQELPRAGKVTDKTWVEGEKEPGALVLG